LDKLPRFAICLAIGIGITIFALFMYSILPHIIQNSSNDWDRAIGGIAASDDKILELFEVHPAYIVFYEIYPDAKQELGNRHRGDGNLQVGIMNFDTNNQLVMDMYYDKWADSIRVNVRCNIMDENGNHNRNLSADGLFVEDFIRHTSCVSGAVFTDFDDNSSMNSTDSHYETRELEGVITIQPRISP